MILLAILCAFVGLSTSENVNFTLDVNYPIVFTDKFTTTNDSYFGATVSLAAYAGPSSASAPTGWLFVGAPKSGIPRDVADEDGFTMNEKPGVLWRCNLGKHEDNSLEDRCEIVRLEKNFPDKNKILGNPHKENVDDHLLGISLSITNDRLVTCSPKFVRGSHYLNGICYWLSSDPAVVNSYTKDNTQSIINIKTFDHRLLPFYIRVTDQDYGKYQLVTINSGTTTDGSDWSTGEAGLSVHITSSDDDKSRVQVLIGAPGARLWSGAIVIYTDVDNPDKKLETTRVNRANKPYFARYVVLHRGQISKTSTNIKERNLFDYFGYAVTSGKLATEPWVTYYVGGSPRGNDLKGEVVVFKYKYNNSQAVRIQISDIITILQPKEDIFASYFGSVLYSMDMIGNDGNDEIFVGAPLYAMNRVRQRRDAQSSASKTKTTNIRVDGTGDHGAVFVFQYDPTEKKFKEVSILVGNGVAGSRFGSAMSSITTKSKAKVDIVKQLVIGAPYENCESERISCGAVYIYESNGESLQLKYKIDPSTVNYPYALKGFGSSLSPGVDIDKNGTPDLAVGVFESQKVVVVRSRLPLNLIGSVEFHHPTRFPENTKPIAKLPLEVKEIAFFSCIEIVKDENFLGLPHELEIQMHLTVDKEFDRFQFTLGPTSPPSQEAAAHTSISKVIEVGRKGACTAFKLKLKGNASFSDNTTTLSEIKVIQELHFNPKLDGGKPRQVNIMGNKKAEFTSPLIKFDYFQREIPFPTTVKTEHGLLISPTDCKSEHCKPIINFNTSQFYTDDAKTKPITSYTIGSTDLILEIKIINTGETALKPIMSVEWNTVEVNKIGSPKCTKVKKQGATIQRGLVCEYPNSIQNKAVETVELKFDMRYLYAKPDIHQNGAMGKYFEVKLAMKQYDETDFKEHHYTMRLPLKVDSRIMIMGVRDSSNYANPFPFKVMSPNNYQEEQKFELFSPISQKFEIRLSGKSAIDTFKVKFQIPIKEKDSAKEIILVQSPPRKQSKGAYTVTCNSENFFDIIRLDSLEMPSTTEEPYKPTYGPGGNVEISQDNKNSREKRSADSKEEFKKSTTQSSQKKPKISVQSYMTHLNCDDGQFECMIIECEAERKLSHGKSDDEQLTIFFDLYLVRNVTEDLIKTGKEAILIESKGTVEIFEGEENYKKDEDVSQILLTKMKNTVQPWVYAVAVLIAILLLAFIIFFLYKCGFFKREVHEKLLEAKADERRKSMMVPQSSTGVNYDTFGDGRDELLDKENTKMLSQKETLDHDTENPTK